MAQHDVSRRDYSAFDILDLAHLLRRRYLTILAFVLVAIVVSVSSILLSDDYYRAEAVLSPAVEQSSADATSALLGSLGPLSQLLGSSNQQSISIALAILDSRQFNLDFLENSDALQLLIPEYWDTETQDWVARERGPLAYLLVRIGILRRITDQEAHRREEALRRFSLLKSITVDQATQIVTLSIEWTDPYVAALWVNSMVDQLNEYVRQREIRESRSNIQFLETEIETTTVVSLRDALYGLLEQEVQSSMVANVRKDYALQVIDPALPASRPQRPNRVSIILLASLAGVVLATLHILLRSYLSILSARKDRET